MRQKRTINLDAIYNLERGPAFLTGIQALVRLPLMQRRLDRFRGLDTAGLVSGYRGSPLGAFDQQLWKARKFLDAHDIIFQPGLNEDLAATALWGAQMHKAFGDTKTDGVFGIWYGKGNGVDRSGDVFRNANMLGTSKLGGVLAVAGDDHAAQSSMFPHQTDGIFHSVQMPVLQPANVAEILSLGLAGIALSRFSGVWVAMKTIAEVVESAASFELPNPYPSFLEPLELVPPHGLNWDPQIEWPAQRGEYERRMIEERMPAVIGWATVNRIDTPIRTSARKRLCIVTVGKAHQDLMQALFDLAIGQEEAEALGLSVYKVGMSWPLAVDSLIAFAGESEEIFVVEEKAANVETQIKAALFNRARPRVQVTGKTDLAGRPLLPIVGEFSPLMVAEALVSRMADDELNLSSRLAALRTVAVRDHSPTLPSRKPFFCAGCPHNSSMLTPQGSIAGGGIGCHVMALSVPKLKTTTFSQMGGEGMQWVGAAPFSKTAHIFQNLGDGTYQHSGLLAIRAAVAAQANITFKILYNDAVAMTGGQPAEGASDPPRLIRQLRAEGVSKIWLVSDRPERWRNSAHEAQIAHRDDLDKIQRSLRETSGVTAIVYEQTCAAEKRRRRKRGVLASSDKRLFINPRVCEACGDCSAQSNCIAVQPLQTADGIKRRIDQSACNTDFSCVKGFCPSFVEVNGAELRAPDGDRIVAAESQLLVDLPKAKLADFENVYEIYVAGIGGLGVLTVGALLGMAAHLDGLTSTVLDFTGLAQKNGAVVSQVRIGTAKSSIHAVRIGSEGANLLLGTDLVVASSSDARVKIASGRTAVVINLEEVPTADFVHDRSAKLPVKSMIDWMMKRAGRSAFTLDATSISRGLFGTDLATNTLMVGFALQKGLLPFSAEAFERAIEENGVAVALNKRAFAWGRLTAADPQAVARVVGLLVEPMPENLDVTNSRRARELAAYQDQAYADRFTMLIAQVERASSRLGKRGDEFSRLVSANAYKLMAYKDEYEVARLYSEPAFRRALDLQFVNARRASIYLAPPLLSRVDPTTGRPKKRCFGPWIFVALKFLAKCKRLRGTWMDPFGATAERKEERALRDSYIEDVQLLLDRPDIGADTLVAFAALPDEVRGFGPIKRAAIAEYYRKRASLLSTVDIGCPIIRAAQQEALS